MSLLNRSLRLRPIKHDLLREGCVCMTKFPPRDYTEPQVGAINTVERCFLGWSYQYCREPETRWKVIFLLGVSTAGPFSSGIPYGRGDCWEQPLLYFVRPEVWPLITPLAFLLHSLAETVVFSHWHGTRVSVVSWTAGSQGNDRTRKIAINSEYSLSSA